VLQSSVKMGSSAKAARQRGHHNTNKRDGSSLASKHDCFQQPLFYLLLCSNANVQTNIFCTVDLPDKNIIDSVGIGRKRVIISRDGTDSPKGSSDIGTRSGVGGKQTLWMKDTNMGLCRGVACINPQENLVVTRCDPQPLTTVVGAEK